MGQTDNSFNLSVPMTASALQQGEQAEATVGIKRAKNFDGDVTLKFSDVPAGVTVEPVSPTIKHGDADAKITFKATDEAPLGSFNIKVVGHPANGADAQVDFKLAIAAKDGFTLNAPSFSTSVKQGATQTIAIGISRDKNFDQDVALTWGDLPAGITLKPESNIIKHGESEARLTIVAAHDASLGDFAIKLIGHPATGADATAVLKLVVIKK